MRFIKVQASAAATPTTLPPAPMRVPGVRGARPRWRISAGPRFPHPPRRYWERGRVGDGFGRFAFAPERPARTITLLVRLTASRST